MTPTQHQAIHNIVHTDEQLQAAWNNPRRFRLPGFKNREVLIILIVAKDRGSYKWSASARVYNPIKKKIKSPAFLTKLEQTVVKLMLISELNGVGHIDRTEFRSKYALHLEARVTGDELGESLRPDLARNGKIVDQSEAIKLLDKLEDDLRPRIIKPNGN